jgi:hypothetical protein
MNYWSGTEPRNSWTEYFSQVSDADLELALELNNFEVFQGVSQDMNGKLAGLGTPEKLLAPLKE